MLSLALYHIWSDAIFCFLPLDEPVEYSPLAQVLLSLIDDYPLSSRPASSRSLVLVLVPNL